MIADNLYLILYLTISIVLLVGVGVFL